MSRNRLIIAAIVLAILVGAFATIALLPRHYAMGERLSEVDVFWHDKEAFIFLNVSAVGRSTNVLQEKLSSSRWFEIAASLSGFGPHFLGNSTTAYRLLPSGQVNNESLPPRSAAFGNWTLRSGNIELIPSTTARGSNISSNGFRWDGSKFVPLLSDSSAESVARRSTTLSPDDAEDEEPDSRWMMPSAKQAFKNAGWHYKRLTGYEAVGAPATLPIALDKTTFTLTMDSFPEPTDTFSPFDMLNIGAKSVTISRAAQPQRERSLWDARGWQPISKTEFESRVQQSGRANGNLVFGWVWVVALLLVVALKFGSWGGVFLRLFTVKRRMLQNMATSYSFPPATPENFPLLDVAALDRYTRELTSLGFAQLAEFSLVSDAPRHIPIFSRLFAHTRHHCFAEAAQIFPPGKAPLPLKCAIQSSLEDSWNLTFSDRKPRAAGVLVRRKKSLNVCMPDATTNDLLNAFLQMRSQVCQDLGISPLKEDTFEAYKAKVQRSVGEMRTAVEEKNFAGAIPQIYLREFMMLKTKPEYMWLGDYPKEAERRRQGYVSQVRPLA